MSDEPRWMGHRLGSPENPLMSPEMPEERRSSISEAMEELRAAIDDHASLTDHIIGATAPFRTPVPPRAMAVPDGKPGAPLAIAIREMAHRLRQDSQNLREVVEGLTA